MKRVTILESGDIVKINCNYFKNSKTIKVFDTKIELNQLFDDETKTSSKYLVPHYVDVFENESAILEGNNVLGYEDYFIYGKVVNFEPLIKCDVGTFVESIGQYVVTIDDKHILGKLDGFGKVLIYGENEVGTKTHHFGSVSKIFEIK